MQAIANSMFRNLDEQTMPNNAEESLVATRIAFFEKQDFPHRKNCMESSSKEIASYSTNDPILDEFLRAIGEDPSQHQHLRTNNSFQKLALEWYKCLEERKSERKDDESYYHLSDDLDALDAFIHADCRRTCAAEASAIQLLTTPCFMDGDSDRCFHDNISNLDDLSSKFQALAKTIESWAFPY